MAEATPPTSSDPSPKRELGIGAMFGVLIGGGCLLFALIGVINTATGGKWALRVSGATVDLPTNYEVCAGLVAVGVLFIVLSVFGSFVAGKFRAAKGKPVQRVGIVVAALVLLVVAGRGLQIAALTNTYGSMLAYYATDGDLDDVAAELAKSPSHEDLDQAVGRAAQYDNVGALELLLEAGADLRDETTPEEFRGCVLGGVGPAFVKLALDHGVGPDSCPDSEALIWVVVNGERDDAEMAEIVTMLIAAGWSTTATPEFSEQAPADLAKQRARPNTAALLGGG